MNQLKEFIAHARAKGMDHATIRVLLLSAGWKERDIAEALTEETLDMPIPLPADSGGARDAFFHLLSFAALYTTVISLIVLFFNYFNAWLPDPALETYPGDISGMLSSIRWSMAAVIVSFPLYLWITRILVKEMTLRPEKAVSGVRRWLTYLTLFVTAAAMMGDVITLVFYLLDGETTPRFFLKVFTVLLLAGMTFTYYFLALRTTPDRAAKMGLHRSFGMGAIAIVLVAIIWGMILAGSPQSQRAKQFDDRRVEDFRVIQNEIHTIVYGTGMLAPGEEAKPKRAVPATLEEVQKLSFYQKISVNDPETNEPYTYNVHDAKHYALCATFKTVRDQNMDIFWNHPAANHCFEIDVTSAIR